MESLSNCLVCDNESFTTFLDCPDHFLTHESFRISQCEKCGFLFTNPRPSAGELPAYYQSAEYISHSNSHQGMQNMLYQWVRKYTLGRKYKLIQSFKQGTRLLDIGCATGEFLHYFKKRNWETFGIEPDARARQLGISNYALTIEDEDYLQKLPDASFDVITMWHVLEHVPLLNERIAQLQRLLSSDGVLFIAVPNPSSPDAVLYGSFWAAYDVPRHLYHFTQQTITRLFSKHDFNLVRQIPMKFDAYYVSLLSEKYMHVKNRFFNGILSGFVSNRAANRSGEYSSIIYAFRKVSA
jgi:2-polyprenyl-3-methyl-5-hydroxy-6-metoxy-1,4-benzoquinol methylase